MNAALRAVVAKAGSRKLLLAVAAAATAAANHQWAAVASIVIAYVLAEAHVDASAAKASESVVQAAATAVAAAVDSGRNPGFRPEATETVSAPAAPYLPTGTVGRHTAIAAIDGPVSINPARPTSVTVEADVPFTLTHPAAR